MKREKGVKLLELARRAIEATFTKREMELEPYKRFDQRSGVFVTLTKEGELRGCIGYPVAQFPLYQGVIHAARAAAFDDPRFPALEPEELGEVRIEVTVLTEPKRLDVAKPAEYKKKIKVGRDGLIIRQGFHTGLLLPQVPVEYGWNTETYLEHLCLKAGLPKDAWKEKGTTIEAFQGEIFSEP
jgi:AmmeMemoRadiSam system protein A